MLNLSFPVKELFVLKVLAMVFALPILNGTDDAAAHNAAFSGCSDPVSVAIP